MVFNGLYLFQLLPITIKHRWSSSFAWCSIQEIFIWERKWRQFLDPIYSRNHVIAFYWFIQISQLLKNSHAKFKDWVFHTRILAKN